jgi:hypothetical protein
MRWQVRHNNRVWHVFDTVRYTADVACNSRAEAKQLVDMFNAKELRSA